ncbi:MAG: divalent metal cation transporter [Phycisphaerae bacterium]|nr:divalent metal cation transporter [Phycisphaerae bacterium]
MADENSGIDRDRRIIEDAQAKGRLATLGAYFRLSGPGWLQSAITLGGGSLGSSLFLGVLAGFALLWLQPLAMIMGIIMLSAIGYVTLSTGERPFDAINKHINPVLGWGWILATLMANCVWALPQFSLATAAIKQNLLTNLAQNQSMSPLQMDLTIGACVMVLCVIVVWFYNSGGFGLKIFNTLIKLMVAGIVLAFVGVVVIMSLNGALDWGKIGGGLIPDFSLFWTPAETFDVHIAAVSEEFRNFWTSRIVSQQQDVMIAAAATAVGINMTFLLPYSMLKRKWDKNFRGLAIFDLSTGLFIPFILATGCVVIASASQFHTQAAPGFLGEKDQSGQLIAADKKFVGQYNAIVTARVKMELGERAVATMSADQKILLVEGKSKDELKQLKQQKGDEAFAALSAKDKTDLLDSLPKPDKRMAAMLVKRDSGHLAASLTPLTGKTVSDYVFGLGVIGMAISSIIILMLINGFVICAMFGAESKGWLFRLGTLMPCVGMLAPVLWAGKTKMWLVMPTSIINFTVLPIAYFAFYMMMNQKSLMGDNIPKGLKRLLWNFLMTVAAGSAAVGSVWTLWLKMRWNGIYIAIGFTVLVILVHFIFPRKKRLVA